MITSENIQSYLEKYGCEVSVAPDGENFESSYRAFVQPLRYKNKMYLEGTRTRIGYADQSYYLYVGPATVNVCGLSDKAVLRMGDGRFYFSHCESVQLADETIYMWAILRSLIEEV